MVGLLRRALPLLLALLLAGATPALAQSPSSPQASLPGSPASSPSDIATAPPLERLDPNAPLPPMTIDAGQEMVASDGKTFTADGNVHIVGGKEFELRADHVEGDLITGVTAANGHLYLRELDSVITASSMRFNLKNQIGVFTNVSLTQQKLTITADHITISPVRVVALGANVSTCPPGMPQDYHIRTRSLVYDEQADRITAIGAAIYLGGTRIWYFPYLAIPLARSGQSVAFSQVIRQQFGYNRYDGVYVGVNGRWLIDRYPLTLSVVLPQRSAIEGHLITTIPLIRPRSRPRRPSGTSPGPIAILRQFAQSRAPLLPDGDPLLFHNFGVPSAFDTLLSSYFNQPYLSMRPILGVRDRIFGKGSGNLQVSRLPEVNFLGYFPIAGPQSLPTTGDPNDVRRALRKWSLRLSFDPQFGYYEEFPENSRHSRDALALNLDSRPLLIGPNTFFYPRLGIQSNTYSGGYSYHYFQTDVGIERFLTTRTAFGLEYIKSEVGGRSPFFWDTLDTANELDLRGQYGNSHHIISLLLRYDLTGHDLYSWDLTYGHVLHCLVPTISYDARSHNIGFGLNIEGLTFY